MLCRNQVPLQVRRIVRSMQLRGLLLGGVALTTFVAGGIGPVPDQGSAVAARTPPRMLLTYVASHRYKSNWRICAAHLNGTHQVRLVNRGRPEEGLTWSPDGQRLAYASLTPRADSDILVTNPRLTAVANITHGFTNRSWSPSWSPSEGTRIAFVGGAEGSFPYVASADGKHGLHGEQGPTRIPFPYPYVTGIDWFPDVRPGAWFLIEAPSPETGIVGLYRVGLDGGGLELLVPDARNAAISPDAQKIAFVRDTNAKADLYVADLGSMTEQRLTSTANRNETEPAWSPDGKWIAFTRLRQRYGVSRSDVGIVRPDGSDLHMVIHGRPYDASSPAWRPAEPLPPAKRAAC